MWCWSGWEDISHVQGQRNPSNTVDAGAAAAWHWSGCKVQFQLLNLLIQKRWNVKLALLTLGCVTFELESSLSVLICERGIDVLSLFLLKECLLCGASQVALVVKNLPANAGGTESWVRSLA